MEYKSQTFNQRGGQKLNGRGQKFVKHGGFQIAILRMFSIKSFHRGINNKTAISFLWDMVNTNF